MTPKLHVGSEIILRGLLNPETHGCWQFGLISDSRIYFLTDTHRFFLMLACCSMTFFKKWGWRAGSSVTSRDCSCRGHRVTHGHPWCLPCLAHLVSICGLLQAWSPAYHSRAKRSRCFPDSPDWEALVPKLSCVMILFPSVLQKLETTAGSTVTSRPSGPSHLQWEGSRVLLQVPSAPWYPRTWTFFALDCIVHFSPT